MWSSESRNTRPQGAERADARRSMPWHRRVVAAFLSVALVAGVAPWDARAFAENVSGGGSSEIALAEAGMFDEPVSDGGEGAGSLAEPADEPAAETPDPAASSEGAGESDENEPAGEAAVPLAARTAAADEPAADEPAAQVASLPIKAYGKGTAGTAPVRHALGETVAGSDGDQDGMVSMVGSYQFNATGNTNVRGKYTSIVAQALHSSRVEKLTSLSGAAADKALSGYDMAPMSSSYVGGKTTGGAGTGNYPATGNNSSSAELVRSSDTAKIVKAYLVIACTQSADFVSATSPLAQYGVSFMAPDEDAVYRMYPEVVYRDNGASDNGAKARYSCFFDVTDIVTSQKNRGYGWYTVLNIPMTSMSGGTDRNKADVGTDYFGSWRLVVVEEETTLPPRMLRLKLGGVAVQNGGAANVEISGEGLSVAPNPTGQLIASMDGTDCDSGNTQNISYTTSASSSAKIVTNNAMGRALGNKYFRLRIDNGSLLSDATSFDPAPINVNASGHSYESNAIKTTHNTDLTIQEINDNHGGMTLTGGESRVNMTVSTSSAPTILSVLGLALDIVAPEFRTTLTIANLDQHYSTADAGYEDKPNGRYAQTASAGDTLRATMVCENVSDSKKFIGLQDPVVTLKMKSFKTIDEDSISAFFYPGLYRDDSSQRPESEGKIILDNVQVTYNDAEGCYEITASSNKLEKIQEKGYFEVTFTGQANDSIDYVEYENYAAVEGDYVDEQNSVHDAFHMAALGSVYTTTASDKARYPLTVTAVGPGQATGTAKYYEGDIAEISWEADADAHVAAVFEDSSVRDDLVADSKAAPSQARMLALLRSVIRATPLANSAEVTMEDKAKEVIIVFEADGSDADDPEGPDNTVQENAFAVNTVADGGVASMTDSGTVQKGSDYSVSWSVKPGYRIVSVEVDGVAVPFNEGTSSIDFSQIGANHTVKVLTQRVASDGSDGTWVVSTTISGPGTISPTKAVRAGESYQVEWGAQAGSTDAVLSLVKVDGQVVYDEYLNNPKTDTDNETKKDQTSVSFDNIRGNHTVEVVYRGTTVQNTYADDHVVDTAISGGLGTISPSVTVPESSTEDVTVTVTPEGGSEVEGIYLVRGSVRQLLENGKNGVVIATGADGKVTVTLPRDAIDANCTVEAILSAPDSDPGTPPSATYQITTAIAGGSGGKITASQIGIAAGESRQIRWESDADRHVIAVMVDGKMRDDLLTQGGVDFTNISGDHSVIVYVSDRESSGGDNPGGEPVNPDNPDGHDPNPVDPTNPERPGTPGNPGGIPSQPGDERYLYVNVTTIGAGVATPSVSAKVGGDAEVSWKAARGHKVASVIVDGIERLDLMRDLERGELSFENIQRSHSVVVRFEKDPDYDPATDDREDPEDPDEAYDPDDPRDDIDVTDPAGYSLVTTKILGGSGDITGTTYNAPGSKRVVSWAPAEGYYVQAVYVDGKEITLADGQTSYEFADLEGGVHHSIEVRMAPLVPEEPDDPNNPDGPDNPGNPDGNGPGDGEGPDIVIDEPVTFPPMPGGVITPDDILDFIEDTFGDHPGLPDGVPEVVIRKDGQVVDKIDQSVPGTYVIEVTYTAADGTKKVVRLTYVVPGDGGAGGEGGAVGSSGDDATKVSLRDRLALAQTGDGVAATTAAVLALALAAAAVLILARRRLGA